MARGTNKPAPVKSLEQTLWDAADKMRGNLEAAEYKHVALGLVFFKYVSDAFEQRRRYLVTATAQPESDYYIPNPNRRGEIVESRDEYTSESVFWFPSRRDGSTSKATPSSPRSVSCLMRRWTP